MRMQYIKGCASQPKPGLLDKEKEERRFVQTSSIVPAGSSPPDS